MIISRAELPSMDPEPTTQVVQVDVPAADHMSPEQRAYEAYWYAQRPRRRALSGLGLTVVPCARCSAVSPFAVCGLCGCGGLARLLSS